MDAGVSDSPCWKSTLRDCRKATRTVCSNWKVRVSGFYWDLPSYMMGHSEVILVHSLSATVSDLCNLF